MEKKKKRRPARPFNALLQKEVVKLHGNGKQGENEEKTRGEKEREPRSACPPSGASAVVGRSPHVQDVVAPDEHLPEVPGELSVDELLRGRELEVHVGVDGDEVA